MVVGESQILGQFKQAYQAAVRNGTAGRTLNKLAQFSFRVAKQIRRDTGIGDNPVSVAYAAVKLAGQIHGDLTSRTALLIGAGDTINLVANHLRAKNIGDLRIANRTFERAKIIADRYGATAVRLEALPEHLPAADIVVSSTASPLAVISASAVEQALRLRHGAPIFLVDLAVPRDIDPAVAALADAYLYAIDDLRSIVNENARMRELAAAQAEEIVAAQARSFIDWEGAHDSEQTIIAIRESIDDLKGELVEKARRRLAAGDAATDVLVGLANQLTNKILHRPTTRIREAGIEGQDDVVRIARDLLDPKN
jgi:glutamyl-tRNA reductase